MQELRACGQAVATLPIFALFATNEIAEAYHHRVAPLTTGIYREANNGTANRRWMRFSSTVLLSCPRPT